MIRRLTAFSVHTLQIGLSTAKEYLLMTLVGQGFKVTASIGGWNFPSHYFFVTVSTQDKRAKFITSAKDFLTQ